MFIRVYATCVLRHSRIGRKILFKRCSNYASWQNKPLISYLLTIKTICVCMCVLSACVSVFVAFYALLSQQLRLSSIKCQT